MGNKKKVNKNDIALALLIEEMLDYVPTNLKYNSILEKFLLKTLGHGVMSKEKLQSYKTMSDNMINMDDQRYNGIPGYISEEDLTIWQANKIIYDAGKIEQKDSYPEGYNAEISKQYILSKRSD